MRAAVALEWQDAKDKPGSTATLPGRKWECYYLISDRRRGRGDSLTVELYETIGNNIKTLEEAKLIAERHYGGTPARTLKPKANAVKTKDGAKAVGMDLVGAIAAAVDKLSEE